MSKSKVAALLDVGVPDLRDNRAVIDASKRMARALTALYGLQGLTILQAFPAIGRKAGVPAGAIENMWRGRLKTVSVSDFFRVADLLRRELDTIRAAADHAQMLAEASGRISDLFRKSENA